MQNKGPFTLGDNVCNNVNFFMIQTMGSRHANTCVSEFYCDIDLNSEVVIDAVADALSEWTFKLTITADHIDLDREYKPRRL